MLLVQLRGGLGNQLFQYAIGRKLSNVRKQELLFDVSALESSWSYRQYQLGHFRIQGRLATERELHSFYFYQKARFVRRIDSVLQSRLPYYRRRVFVEQCLFLFDPNVYNASENVSLRGYWQSEKYFQDIRNILLDELRVNEPYDLESQRLLENISLFQSVSLHIRRGDYVSNSRVNQVHGVLPLDYYKSAMKIIVDRVEQPRYFVFSDDIAWARQNLDANNITFVEHNGAHKDYVDMALMSACKFHIIANSSFSWWGAWLSTHPEKLVVAPRQWMREQIDFRDLIPAGWVTA